MGRPNLYIFLGFFFAYFYLSLYIENPTSQKFFLPPKIGVRSYCPKALRHFSRPPADSILSRRKNLNFNCQKRCSFFKSQPHPKTSSSPNSADHDSHSRKQKISQSRHYRFLMLRRIPNPRAPHCLAEVGAITPPRLARAVYHGGQSALRLKPLLDGS